MTQTIFGNKAISSLYINNKEVQSIVTNDNVVLYEKENSVTPVVSEPSNIVLSTSKNILSMEHNDSAILTATVTDENDNFCSNKPITFKMGNTVVGVSNTNSNGEASINYTANGTGINLTFQATYDNIQSNTLTIDDYIFYDDASTNKSNDLTIIKSSNETYSITYDSNGYLLTRSGKTNVFTSILFTETNIIPFEFTMDVNITQKTPTSGGYNLVFAVQDTYPTSGYVNNNSIQIGTWSSSKFYRYFTGTTVNSNTSSSGVLASNTWFTLFISYDGSTLTIKIVNTSTGTQVIGKTISNVSLNYNKYYYFVTIMCGSQSKQYIKNIKIKKI